MFGVNNIPPWGKSPPSLGLDLARIRARVIEWDYQVDASTNALGYTDVHYVVFVVNVGKCCMPNMSGKGIEVGRIATPIAINSE